MNNRSIKLKGSFFTLVTLMFFVSTFSSFSGQQNTQRIVSLGGTVTETLFALGVGDKVVGVDVSSIYPKETEKLAKVGYWRRISPEGILSLKPTDLIATYDSGPDAIIEQIEKSGVKLTKIPAVFTFQQVKDNINIIANAVGKTSEASKLVLKLDADYNKVSSKIKKLKKSPKALFLYLRNGKVIDAGGKNTPADGMIKIAGGKNVANGLDGWKTVTSEFFLTAQPEVIILTKTGLESAGGINVLKTIPGLSATPAIKNGNVLILDDIAFLGFGPRFVESLDATVNAFAKVK